MSGTFRKTTLNYTLEEYTLARKNLEMVATSLVMVTNSFQKCHHCTQIWDISEDPPIAHSIDEQNNDYMMN